MPRWRSCRGRLFKIMEIALIAAVAYHAFDGVRLLIVHYFNVIDYRKSMFYAAFAVAAFFTAVGGLLILHHCCIMRET